MLEEEAAEALARLEALDPEDPGVTLDSDRADMRRIGAALYAVDYAHTSLVQAVANARQHGRSWTDIANVLGVSRQAARQRFSDHIADAAHQDVLEPAEQKLLDAGFSAVESRFALLLACASVAGDAGDRDRIVGIWASEVKRQAFQELLQDALTDDGWGPRRYHRSAQRRLTRLGLQQAQLS
jgi:hypothetical protein